MKLSMQWLREHLDTTLDAGALAERFTLAGLECEIEALCPDAVLKGVVVARIAEIAPHPEADRLRVCRVDAGDGALHGVVCGAENAAVGLITAFARPGAVLPDGRAIAATELRGVPSAGMLCSAAELGLAESSSGLLTLDDDAVPGTPLAEWLKLDDTGLFFELTPDRGDCLSVAGLAREAAAIDDDCALRTPPAGNPAGSDAASGVGPAARDIAIDASELCPVYCGRRIEGVDARRRTPDWLRERLRRAGVRSVSLVVDITNLVMLESGQPLHAFDDARLEGTIRVRQAQPGESLRLLNEQDLTLDHGELVIADDARPVALAGVMGGEHAEMRLDSTTVFLESACFLPAAVAGTGRRHKLHSDAVHRFERGVDPAAAERALERATALIVAMAGGTAGPPRIARIDAHPVWAPTPILLRRERIAALLGVAIPDDRTRGILESLGMQVDAEDAGWRVLPPSWRFDIAREVDLIEEVARVYGYDRVGDVAYAASIDARPQAEAQLRDATLRDALVARGFQEAVCYSFVETDLDAALRPDASRIPVDNPIAAPYSCMRTTLWSGLLPMARYNVARQARRLRAFELARVYEAEAGVHPTVRETECLAGLMLGPVEPEQWGTAARAADFHDLKGELQALVPDLVAEAATHPALHPSRSARLLRGDGAVLGWMGQLHPALAAEWELPEGIQLFELDAEVLRRRALPWQPSVPEYPSSRRDLSLEIDADLPCADLLGTIREHAPETLQDVVVFDVYHGPGVKNGSKAIALGLIFQDHSRTLTDELVDQATNGIVDVLGRQWGARIRG